MIGRFIIIFYLLFASTGCTVAAPLLPAEWRGVDLRQRYIELLPQVTGAPRYDPAMQEVLEEYHRRTRLVPARTGRIKGVVLDEQGKALQAVTLKILWEDPGEFFKAPKVTHSESRTIDGRFKVDYRGSGMINLTFSKPGYRTSVVLFNRLSDRFRSDVALRAVQRGFVRPAPNDPETLYFVLPPEVRWDPEGDSNAWNLTPRRAEWPQTSNAPAIASSEGYELAAAPVRGTYVITDRDGKVVALRRLDAGSLLGFRPFDRPEELMYVFSGNTGGLPTADGPYRWRLYSEAESLPPPTTQPADRPATRPWSITLDLEHPEMVKAPIDGVYELFDGSGRRIARQGLVADESIGFEERHGEWSAVSGRRSFAISPEAGPWEWRLVAGE